MKNYTNYILLAGLLNALLSCSGNKKMSDDDLIEITSRTEEGFHDIVLNIVDTKLTSNGDYEIIAKGKNNEETVGLKIKIKDKLKAGLVNGGFDGFDSTAVELNGVSFYSIGPESDNLIRTLSKLYGSPTDKKFTTSDLSFDMFSLNKEVAELNKGYFQFKIFFDPYDSLGLYSELFLNVNLPKKEVEINEKDWEYRESLVKVLTR
ncbi:MAG: hypothetical protein ABI663_24535 [Chryseolinea sp.]